MTQTSTQSSDLILNADGSIYHLHLKPEQIADTILTVSDPGCVAEVSRHFDMIQYQVKYREFITHTGYYNNKRLSVISTGIGADNLDIVLSELDALANIDFENRNPKKALTSLDIIRLGTSGSVSDKIGLDELIVTEIGIGLDGLMNFYEYENSIQETVYIEAFYNYIHPHFKGIEPYISTADPTLIAKFEPHFKKGVTVSTSGFYAPQGRTLRMPCAFPDIIKVLSNFRHKHFRISNLEMGTAGLYGLGKALGHRCVAVNAVLSNRITGSFSANPKKVTDEMMEKVLEIITVA